MPAPLRSVLLWAVCVRMMKRKDQGATQAELARECGVSPSTVCRWLTSECVSGSALKLEQALRALGGKVTITNAKPVHAKLRVVA